LENSLGVANITRAVVNCGDPPSGLLLRFYHSAGRYLLTNFFFAAPSSLTLTSSTFG
jgi:hypothetical protein